MSDENSVWPTVVSRAKDILRVMNTSPEDIRRRTYEYLVDKGMPIDEAYSHARRTGEHFASKQPMGEILGTMHPAMLATQLGAHAIAGSEDMKPAVERFQKETEGQEQPAPTYGAYASGGSVGHYPLQEAWQAYREGMANGGTPDSGDEMPAQAPARTPVRPRFRIASAGAGAASPEEMGGYQFQKLEEGKANTNSLKMAFDRAIQRHTSLPESQRIANSKAAIKTLEPYLGKGKSGPISLFTKNGKMMKAEQGTGDSEPVMLDDGRGVETMGLNLYPDYREGEFKMCPNSASCRGACLGKTSGQNKEEYKEAYARAKKVHPQDRALNRTKAMLRDPEAFAVRLWDEIESMRRQAELRGNHLGVRLNGLSDMNPIIHKSLIESQPLVSFYDYTKMKWRPVAENHHYTYSSTGTSNEDVENPHQNWNRMRNHLEQGDNVAMAFSYKGGVPKFVHDEETGKKYRVVSGDEHDFRPMDIQPEGETGVIVGLKNKDNSKGSDQKKAHIRSKGFFVKYNPKTDGDTAFIPEQKKKEV